jgi:two-component system, OmpR family, sensor kinase
VTSDDAAENVRRVLLIEDDDAHAYFISRYLSQVKGVRIAVSRAATLANGLRLLASQPFDAVLLDLRLPDSDFDETLSRTLPNAFDVPIIVLSTLYDPTLAERVINQGAQDFLYKGDLSPELLCRAITQAVERQGAAKGIREDPSLR